MARTNIDLDDDAVVAVMKCFDFATLPQDFEEAALLHRACRTRGETVRTMIDCLIAAHAIRADVPVLHHDSDFDVLARHTALQATRS